MARRINISQLNSKLRQLESKYKSEVRRYINNYNNFARQYNSGVRKYNQSLRNAINSFNNISRQQVSTHYTVKLYTTTSVLRDTYNNLGMYDKLQFRHKPVHNPDLGV